MQQVSYVYLQESQIAFRPLAEVFAFLDYAKAIEENTEGERIVGERSNFKKILCTRKIMVMHSNERRV